MTPGIDGLTLDGYGVERVNGLIETLQSHSYQSNPARRRYIPKKNGKMRPLGIPSANDKLVQEIVRMMLESIYEPIFSNFSHGFRPKRSCHTALMQIQHSFTAVKWFVEGGIKAYFDTIGHHVLIGILRRRIADESLIELIWKFLKAGYLEDWQYNATFSRTPQGSGISPILANIYLNELDGYMEEYKKSFEKGKIRGHNNEYTMRHSRYQRYVDKCRKHWHAMSKEEKEANKSGFARSINNFPDLTNRNKSGEKSAVFYITKHPNYKYLADADKKNEFDIDRFLRARLRPKPGETFEVYEIDAPGSEAPAVQ